MADGKETGALIDGDRVLRLAFSPGGRTLATGGDGTVRLRDVRH